MHYTVMVSQFHFHKIFFWIFCVREDNGAWHNFHHTLHRASFLDIIILELITAASPFYHCSSVNTTGWSWFPPISEQRYINEYEYMSEVIQYKQMCISQPDIFGEISIPVYRPIITNIFLQQLQCMY